jgi:hypothetical protein
MSHQLSPPALAYVDRRRGYRFDDESHLVGPVTFTANAAGTFATIVGADANLSTGANIIRLGDEVTLFSSSGAVKDGRTFRVTSITSATGTTTVGVTPNFMVATVSGDTLRLVGPMNMYSNAEMDRRLVQLGFTASRVATMTENDKIYQIRQLDDPGSL